MTAAFLLALAGSLVVIAVGWITARPVLGVILLVLALGAIWALVSKLKKGAKKEATQAAA